MKRKRCKLLLTLIFAMLCMMAFSVTAFASGDDWCEYGDYGTPEASESAGVTETSQEDIDPGGDGGTDNGKPLTPHGNLNLVDDVLQTNKKPDDAGSDASTGKRTMSRRSAARAAKGY